MVPKTTFDPNMYQLDKASSLQHRNRETKAQLEDAAEQFEALFIQQLLSEMRKTIDESDFFGDRKAEKMFEGMLDEEMSKEMAKTKSFGLSEMVVKQLINFVEDDKKDRP